MYAQNLITTFPLYARDEDCTHNRHWCAGRALFVQPAPLTRLPSWIIKDPGSGTLSIWVHNRTRDEWINITGLVTTATATVDTEDYLYYNWTSFSAVSAVNYADTRGGTPKGTITWQAFTRDCAPLQMVVGKDSTLWYSELFYVKSGLPEDASGLDPTDATGCIFIDFSDDATVGDIPYHGLSFAQRVFIPCDIGRPDYEVLIDGPEDGNRNQDPGFRKTIKRVVATMAVPEYMTDALALGAIHKVKTVTDQYDVSATVEDMSVVPDWSTSDCTPVVSVSFRRWFARKLNC